MTSNRSCQSFRISQLPQALRYQKYLDLAGKALLAKASAMPTACEYLFNTLLAASASRIGSSRVIIKPEGGYSRVSCGLRMFPWWAGKLLHSRKLSPP